MARLALYEYAVFYHHPTTKDPAGNDTTKDSELIVEPKRVLAKDPEHAAKKAARAIPAEYEDKLENCDVIVRPF